MSFYLFILPSHSSIHLSVHPSIRSSICPSIHPSVLSSPHPSRNSSRNPSKNQSTYFHPQIHIYNHLSVFLQISICVLFFYLAASSCLYVFDCLSVRIHYVRFSFCRLRSSLIVISSHSINGSHLLFKTKRGFIHVSTPPPSSLPSFLFPCQVAYLPCIFALKQKKNMRE